MNIDPTGMTPEEFRVKLVLSRDKTLSKELLDSIQMQVQLRLPQVTFGRPWTLRKICGEDFWMQLSKGDRLEAGECMTHLVHEKRLPFVHAGQTKTNSNCYMRI